MSFVQNDELPERDRLARLARTPFRAHDPRLLGVRGGSAIPEHAHPQEEVWTVIEGELDVTVDGVSTSARAGTAAIVSSNIRHSIRAKTDGRAIVVDHPGGSDAKGG